MTDKNARQQIIDQLKDVETILVTVNRNPSVDELSAALGLTLLLNKMNKHATAVFSGDIPPAITFLDPQKTFENTVDSLRDFIIALDKEKADHLRYKVDGDMVKIFITPYRTTISENDLDFSQGDYNVEMVIAVGVQSEEDLDKALADHGRIMHDATVASINNGSTAGSLGTINWDDPGASSYSEMLAGLADRLRSDKNLLDEQIATAFLTGIVAATERFSNKETTSQVMTMAAELMAAGANQQLIASQLQEAEATASDVEPEKPSPSDNEPESDSAESSSTELELNHDEPAPSETTTEENKEDEPVVDRQAADGTMSVSHEKEGDVDEVARQTMEEQQEQATAKAEAELAASLTEHHDSDKLSVADLQSDLKAVADELDQSIEPNVDEEVVLPAPATPAVEADDGEVADEPTFGGVLNATADQAAEDKRRAEEEDRNKTLLSHGSSQYVGNPPSSLPPLNSYAATDGPGAKMPANNAADLYGGDVATAQAPAVEPVTQAFGGADDTLTTPQVGDRPAPTLAELDQQNRSTSVEASPAESNETQPAASTSLPPLPPMPDFSSLPQLEGDPSALPPLPPTPEQLLDNAIEPPAAPPLPPSPASNDPGQFRIPGQ